MNRTRFVPALVAGLVAVVASNADAQQNVIPGTDVELGILGSIQQVGHTGAFPNGTTAMAMSTTSCNPGSVNVPWLAPMQENHPFISFLIARESNGRMEQISDRSYVKHGFFALSSSQCTPCQNPSNGTFLGIGCSDTYGVGNNGDNFWLGPPTEIDPWLGEWDAKCSLFDNGISGGGGQCDGNRTYSSSQANSLGVIGNRITLTDADLNTPGDFYYQGHYTILGEPVGNRLNNTVSRVVLPTWNGSSWQTTEPPGQLDGSVLQRWSTMDDMDRQSNGADDGFVVVGVDATETSPGNWHYEYAIHNLDNSRGFSALRIPLGGGANVSNFGFHDIDSDAGNDWTASVVGSELVFSDSNDNALEWNTIFNVWFDSDTGPLAGSVQAVQAAAGDGADAISLNVLAPLEGGPQIYCTPKVSSAFCINFIGTSSTNDPVSGASDFTVDCTDVQGLKNGLLFGGISGPAALPFVGGTLCVNPPTKRGPIMNSGGSNPNLCDGSYSQLVNDGQVIPIGLDAGSGNTGWYQFWYRDPGNGLGDLGTALSDAVKLDFL